MSLPERLEQAALALPDDADAIRPANGDPHQLLAGLDAEAAERVLAWLLAHSPDEAALLAGAWLDEPEGPAVLARIDEADLPKAGRKALRRVLHGARSRGIDIASGARSVAKVARLPDLDQEISAGYVSPLDPRGSRLVYLVESSPSGGARVFETLLDDDRGIVDFQVYRAGRRQVRDFVRDVTRRKGGFAAVEAEPDAVRALVARTVERHPAERPFPKSFGEWRSRLARTADDSATPGEQVRAALGEGATESAASERLAEAVRARDIGPWPPPPAVLEDTVSELRTRAKEAGDAAEAELPEWTREAVRPLYVGEHAGRQAERFEECAYVYWRRADEELAKACLAAADALRAGQGADVPAVTALADGVAEALSSDLKQSPGVGGEPAADEDVNA